MSKLVIVYWSQSGNTAAMADAVAEGAHAAGADVTVLEVSQAVPAEVLAYDYIALGCPAMGAEVLEEAEFEPFFSSIESGLSGKKVALFGSYGWGDGQWMRDWQQRVDDANASLYNGEGLIINETPDDDGLEQCRQFGAGFAGF